TYHILRRNCIHFAKDLCHRLGCDEELPPWIEALPSRTEGLSQTIEVASSHVRAVDQWLRISEGMGSLRSAVMVADDSLGISRRAVAGWESIKGSDSELGIQSPAKAPTVTGSPLR
ncbi:hypothetical protein FOZ62_020448, partial [Perkinsus olseni]